MKLSTILVIFFAASLTDGYSPMGITTRRSTMTMKRGRGSFKKEIQGGGSKGVASSGNSLSTSRNWILVPKRTVKDLPKEEGKVGLLETQALGLVDRNTNPTGAVSVVKYGAKTYCFSSSCPQCKIPMTKAKCLPPNEETDNQAPRVSCDFCKATFNLNTGEPVAAQQSTGLFGGIAKAVLSAQDSTPLPVYSLGEQKGRILFAMD